MRPNHLGASMMGLEEWGVEMPVKTAVTSDDCFTPSWVMRMFEEYHDPCPAYGKMNEPDDLTGIWKEDKIFINPPYSNPLPWVLKARRSHEIMNNVIVMLLKHDSSTEWYRVLHESGARFIMFNGRLNFTGDYVLKDKKAAAPFPSVLAVLS